MSDPSVIDPGAQTALPPPAAGFQILLLGSLEVTRDGVGLGVSDWQRSALTLLKLLAIAPGHRRSRDELIDTLWPDSTPEAGASNLRSALHQLRRSLGGGDPSPIAFDRGWMELSRTHAWDIDLDRFEDLIRGAGDDQARLQEALVLLRGEPLVEDRYDDWALPLRDRILRLWRDAGLRLARGLEAAGDHDVALTWLEMLLEHDPLDEEVERAMLRALVAAGRRAEASRRYHVFAERLQAELGVSPEEDTASVLTANVLRVQPSPETATRAPVSSPFDPLTEAVGSTLRRRLLSWLLPLAIALLVALPVILLVRPASAVTRLELAVYNQQFMQRGARPAPASIVLLDIDQTSVDDLGRGRALIPRHWLARAVDFLHRAGASAIGLNFPLFNPSTFGSADDLTLALAMRRAGDVVIEETISPFSDGGSAGIGAGSTLNTPIDVFLRSGVHVGVANANLDADGFVRSVDLLQDSSAGLDPASNTEPAFAVALAAVASHHTVAQVSEGLPRNGMLINYLGSQGGDGVSPPEYQLEPVVRGEDAGKPFHNKIVIVQYATSASGKVVPTPVGQIYSGAAQASILATILDRDPIRAAGDTANDLVIGLLALLAALIATRFTFLWSLTATVLLTIAYLFLAALLFRQFNLWIELVSPLITIAISYVVGSAMGMRVPGQRRVPWPDVARP